MSEQIKIEVDDQRTEFQPGDTISGRVSWQANEKAKQIALRLFWFTKGRGTQDLEVVQEMTWPVSAGEGKFSMKLPEEPYSFSGQLVSLQWALEAVILPVEISTIYELIFSPTGAVLVLEKVKSKAKPTRKEWFSQFKNSQ